MIDFASFLFSLSAGFVYYLSFSFRIFPLREGNAGNGLEIMFIVIGFILFTTVARLTVLLSKIIRNKKNEILIYLLLRKRYHD